MKLGMPILYEFNTIVENVKLAKELNLDFIELNLNFSYCQKAMENKEIKKLLNDYQLDATLHFFDEADFGSYDEVVRGYLKLLKKYLKLGKDYLKIVNIHNNVGPVVTISGVKNYIYQKEYDSYIQRLLNNLKKIKRICDRYNIELTIENTKIPEYLKKTYSDLASNGFSFTYDIGHDYNNGSVLLELNKNFNFDYKEFHFHDADGKKDHLALLEGTIELKKYKDMANDYDCYVVLEVKNKCDLLKSVLEFRNL